METKIVDWLLEEDNPPVRLLTLTHLLHRPETDAELKATRARLMDYSVTHSILAHGEQFWADDRHAVEFRHHRAEFDHYQIFWWIESEHGWA